MLAIDKVKLKIGRAQFNKALFPGEYTEKNKMGLYSPEQKAAAILGAFNRSSNIWLDFSPFVNGEKQEKEAVQAAGLAFCVDWFVTFTPEGSNQSQTGQIIGNGTGVAEESIPGVFNIGGESADESLGYHVRFHCEGEGTYQVTARLRANGRIFEDSVTFRVS